jgi:hypothetical protein
MQNVSPGTENEGAGRNVAKGNTHVTGSGIVNVEQKISSLEELSDIGCKVIARTEQTGYPSPNGGVAS